MKKIQLDRNRLQEKKFNLIKEKVTGLDGKVLQNLYGGSYNTRTGCASDGCQTNGCSVPTTALAGCSGPCA